MRKELVIKAGTVLENYRGYLPDEIRDGTTIVNDNGNNSIVYSEQVKECQGFLIEDARSTWYEYIPASVKQNPALVISLHGGMMEGWSQTIFSSWTKVAEREGFLVVCPTAMQRNMWTIDYHKKMEMQLTTPNPTGVYLNQCPDTIETNQDARMLLKLIDYYKEKHDVDSSKIYMHGMSMGDMMTSMMARNYGSIFNGVALTGGMPTIEMLFDGQNVINRGGPVNVCQTHMENDVMVAGSTHLLEEEIDANIAYWTTVNQCHKIPHIIVFGENNMAYFSGKKDYLFREVKNRDHGQTMEEAELVWSNFWERKTENKVAYRDIKGYAFAVDKKFAYSSGEMISLRARTLVHNKYVRNNSDNSRIERGRFLMAPLEDLCRMVSAQIVASSQTKRELTAQLEDGRRIQWAEGNIACVVDNHIHAMYVEAIVSDGQLYCSVLWFFQIIMNYHITECNGVYYCSDHFGQLSTSMSRLLDKLLQGDLVYHVVRKECTEDGHV